MPVAQSNTGRGIFEYITHINGSDSEVRQAQAALAATNPVTLGVYKALNLLPEGELKGWLMANPVQFWKKIITLFTGRKYTTGDYILGERFNDQVLCKGDIGRQEVPDEMVPQAQNFFTTVFGVRIHTEEDLKALDYGYAAYKNRWTSKGVPDEAIERAVFLKQNYFPESYNNKQCWDLTWFERYPLVAPIPGHDRDTLYNGPVPGGAIAVNGVIPVDATSILKQLPPGENVFNPVPLDPDQQTAGGGGGGVITWAKEHPIEAVVISLVAGWVIYEIVQD